MEFTSRFLRHFENVHGSIADFSQYTQEPMLNWLRKLLGLKNKLIHPVIYKMPTRNRKIKAFLHFTSVKREWNILVSRDLPVPTPILWVLSSLPRFRFWGAKLTVFMRRGDNGKRGYRQSRTKSPATWTSRTKCSARPDRLSRGCWGRMPCRRFPRSVDASSRAGIWRSDNRWQSDQYNDGGSKLLFISGKNRSLKADLSLQWLAPLAHMKGYAFSKMNPTLS